MKLGIVTVCYVSNDTKLDILGKQIATYKSQLASPDSTVYFMINGFGKKLSLDQIKQTITDNLDPRWQVSIQHNATFNGLSAAWNDGMRRAFADGCKYALITTDDILIFDDAIDKMLQFGESKDSVGVSFWSPTKIEEGQSKNHRIWFSCAMCRQETLMVHGLFDENYTPVYCEDSDYHARIILDGRDIAILPDASFFHYKSLTLAVDPDFKRSNSGTQANNTQYFTKKWGRKPREMATRAQIIKESYKNPWNKKDIPTSWWPALREDRPVA